MVALRADPSVVALTVADFPRSLLDRWREVAGVKRFWLGGFAIKGPRTRGATDNSGRTKGDAARVASWPVRQIAQRAKKMSQAEGLTDAELRTPRAAAVAGVVFSLLTLTSFGLLRGAIPADPQASGGWLAATTAEVAVALNLIPFAGIAFLWFIGVV